MALVSHGVPGQSQKNIVGDFFSVSSIGMHVQHKGKYAVMVVPVHPLKCLEIPLPYLSQQMLQGGWRQLGHDEGWGLNTLILKEPKK